MQSREAVKSLVLETIKDINRGILANGKKEELRGIGLQGNLDSLSMVNLVVSLEESIKQRFGVSVALAGSDSGDSNPFKNIGTLVDYVCAQLDRIRKD